MEKMNGLTFMIVFGKWAKPKIYLGKGGCYGICLGFISIQFVKYDMEVWVWNANKMINELQAKEVKAFLAGYKNRARKKTDNILFWLEE